MAFCFCVYTVQYVSDDAIMVKCMNVTEFYENSEQLFFCAPKPLLLAHLDASVILAFVSPSVFFVNALRPLCCLPTEP